MADSEPAPSRTLSHASEEGQETLPDPTGPVYPRGLENRLERREARTPPEHARRKARRRDEARRVARAARPGRDRDRKTGHAAGGLDHLEDGGAATRAEVERLRAA